MSTFEDFKLNRQLLNAISDLAYQSPTPIQEKTIPLALAGHDIMGIAQTGTGKTAAYLLPILMKVKYAQGNNPRALIVAPTRELAMQIDTVLGELGKYTDLRHLAVYGGLGPKTQIETVQKGIDILVATPGRLMDIYLAGHLVLKEIRTLVLDEADKMMDMGFMPQIRKILEIIPSKRQNMLFSATMPDKVIKLSEEFLEFPTVVEVAPSATTAETIAQKLYRIPNLRTKIAMLELLLQDAQKFNRVMIFTRTKQIADNVFKYLERKFASNTIRVIHANKGQNTRINAMEAFKSEQIRVLVATDVVARGIDVNKVSQVINFDVPIVYEDYVHRIGRTGRAYEVGEAITFVTMAEDYHIQKIEEIIKMKIPEVDLPRELEIYDTPFEERQLMLREIDNQRKKEDPSFQGAFHEKKKRPEKNKKITKKKPQNQGFKKNKK
ncbi:MAG: DEAD/DEAH box helicase [Microscillaceae bacterium]|jgi:ATP-dependent RNA helicase RhlE|nr:DEAD/DEAH box helicase [Microscillaceae bacterium]